MKIINVKITKRKDKGKWVIRVKNITSGFIVHTHEDESILEFYFDASRFNPYISIE
jgi:hypothetical protein